MPTPEQIEQTFSSYATAMAEHDFGWVAPC